MAPAAASTVRGSLNDCCPYTLLMGHIQCSSTHTVVVCTHYYAPPPGHSTAFSVPRCACRRPVRLVAYCKQGPPKLCTFKHPKHASHMVLHRGCFPLAPPCPWYEHCGRERRGSGA